MTDRSSMIEEQRMRSFLLGTLPESTRQLIEEEFFENEETYEQLIDALNDLIDEYVRGGLNDTERKHVETYVLSSADNQRRLRLAQALARREMAATPRWRRAESWRGGFWIRPAAFLTAASLAIASVSAIAWLALENRRLRGNLQAALNPSAQPTLRPTPAAPAIATVILYPQLSRSANHVPEVTLPLNAALLKINLATEEVFPSYTVTVEAAGRGRIWTASGLARAADGTVTVWLPAEIVSTGSYELVLAGMRDGRSELLGSFPCTVVRR
jgi:hypothetical protein